MDSISRCEATASFHKSARQRDEFWRVDRGARWRKANVVCICLVACVRMTLDKKPLAFWMMYENRISTGEFASGTVCACTDNCLPWRIGTRVPSNKIVTAVDAASLRISWKYFSIWRRSINLFCIITSSHVWHFSRRISYRCLGLNAIEANTGTRRRIELCRINVAKYFAVWPANIGVACYIP